jgi:hypothetical protein
LPTFFGVAEWIPSAERGIATGPIFSGVGLGAGVGETQVNAHDMPFQNSELRRHNRKKIPLSSSSEDIGWDDCHQCQQPRTRVPSRRNPPDLPFLVDWLHGWDYATRHN